ncbi:Uncharacterised protein [Vibrio cholerae]|nr:Uncharacterised protein [Vibrio cholerae]
MQGFKKDIKSLFLGCKHRHKLEHRAIGLIDRPLTLRL